MKEQLKSKELSSVSGGAGNYNDGSNIPACSSLVCTWCGGDRENHASDCPYYARPLTCFHCRFWNGECTR